MFKINGSFIGLLNVCGRAILLTLIRLCNFMFNTIPKIFTAVQTYTVILYFIVVYLIN